MQRWAWVLAAVVAVQLFSQSADARQRRDYQTDPRLQATSIGVGAATTIGFFALRDWKLRGQGHVRANGIGPAGAAITTTMGCLALSPIVGTIMVQRELTFREAYALTADCVVPFVGAWLVNKAFDAHPEWEPRPARKKR